MRSLVLEKKGAAPRCAVYVPGTEERKLLAVTVGSGHYRVVTRWPLTVAFGPHAWMPGFAAALLAVAASYRHGMWFALAAAAIAGAATAP